ncbi:MAG: DUF4926 domain-containing protein [Anaerolineae bacterium]|nr:DUF4926 domain-containing protein [Anaerolineae bacterium]
MFALYEIVQLKKQITKDLPMGAKGTILIIYDEPPLPLAYEVEFLDDHGDTLAILTLTEKDIKKIDS